MRGSHARVHVHVHIHICVGWVLVKDMRRLRPSMPFVAVYALALCVACIFTAYHYSRNRPPPRVFSSPAARLFLFVALAVQVGYALTSPERARADMGLYGLLFAGVLLFLGAPELAAAARSAS